MPGWLAQLIAWFVASSGWFILVGFVIVIVGLSALMPWARRVDRRRADARRLRGLGPRISHRATLIIALSVVIPVWIWWFLLDVVKVWA